MKLSDTDKREVCPRCGWVGRRAFQLDRHDLCEAPQEDLPDPDEESEENPNKGMARDGDDDGGGEDEANASVEDVPRWSRAEARRRGIPSKKTLAVRRITQLELEAGRVELQGLGANEPYDRPRTRGQCRMCPVCQLVRDGKSDGRDQEAWRALGRAEEEVPPEGLACGHRISEVLFRSRPCVFVACKHALYLDVVPETGSIILNFPHLEPGQMPADSSCVLDRSERGTMTLEEIAVVTNLTRERIRQIELRALIRRARPAAMAIGLGPEDVAAASGRYQVGPGADLVETGVEGAVPSDVATLLLSEGGNDS